MENKMASSNLDKSTNPPIKLNSTSTNTDSPKFTQDEVLRFFLDQESRARRMRLATQMKRERYVKLWGVGLTALTLSILFATHNMMDFTPIQEPRSLSWSRDDKDVLQIDPEYIKQLRG